jgi:hypothetical protein
MYYDVINAEYVSGYKIRFEFADGSKGIADLNKIIDKGGVFTELKTVENFKKFFIHKELKVLSWENEIDIASETLYSLAIQEKVSA